MASSDRSLGCKWSAARRFLPLDLDGLAVEQGALSRRRGVEGGEALLRVLLLCALPKASLASASKIARETGLANLNKTALFKRLVQSQAFLKEAFFHTLGFSLDTGDTFGHLNLVAVDATFLCGPGAVGTDQKLHTVYDLGKGLPRSIEITDVRGGEKLSRHESFGPGDLVLADAGYGYNNSFLWALNSKANILIRFNFQTVTLTDEDGNRIWADEINPLVPEEDALDRVVYILGWKHPLRAIGSRNHEGTPVWLLTDLDPVTLPTHEVRQLYRRRWQVELFFKRLKSNLDLDELATRDGPTARAWIWAKLLLASLASLVAHERFSPWGVPEDSNKPLAPNSVRSDDAHSLPAGTHPKTQTRKTKRKEEETRQTTMPLEA